MTELNYTELYQEALNANNQLQTMIAVCVGVIIAITLFVWLMRRKDERLKAENTKKAKLLEDLKKCVEQIEKKSPIEEVRINDLPKDLQERLLDPKSILSRLFYKLDKGKKWREPVLLLIQSDGNIKIKEGAKEGDIEIKMSDAKKTPGILHLKNSKILTLINGNQKIKCWIHHEQEAESYPIEDGHAAKHLYSIVHAIQMNKGVIAGAKKKIPKIVIIIGIIGILAAILYFSGAFNSLLGVKAAETVTSTANTAVQNTTKVIIQG